MYRPRSPSSMFSGRGAAHTTARHPGAPLLLRPERGPVRRDPRLLTGDGQEPDRQSPRHRAQGAHSGAEPGCQAPSTEDGPAMIESQIRELFTGIARGEPEISLVDAELARRRGRARLRWRRAAAAGTPLLAAATVVAVVVTVGLTPAHPRLGTAVIGNGPAAPRQFNPLVPYLSFGWLPAGQSLVMGGVRRTVVSIEGGEQAILGPWLGPQRLRRRAVSFHPRRQDAEMRCSAPRGPRHEYCRPRASGARAPRVVGRPESHVVGKRWSCLAVRPQRLGMVVPAEHVPLLAATDGSRQA